MDERPLSISLRRLSRFRGLAGLVEKRASKLHVVEVVFYERGSEGRRRRW
jgi:hypothetical protein